MKGIVAYVMLFCGLVLISCHSNEMNKLQAIDNMLTLGMVDFAKNEMNKISYDQFSSEEAKAYYPLLEAKIACMAKTSCKDSLLLNSSIEYFWQNSKLFLLSDAYCYKGCLEFLEKRYESAFLSMKKAEYFSRKTNDTKQELKVVKKILEFNSLVGDHEHVRVYRKKWKMLSKDIPLSESPAVTQINVLEKTGRDSLKLNDEMKQRIYFIQKTFMMGVEQELKNNIFLNVSLSVIILFVVLSYLLYDRSKVAESKFFLAEKKMYKLKNSYESQLQLLVSGNAKAIRKMEKLNETILVEQMEVLTAGKKLFDEIENGGTTATWSKKNFEEYNEYFKLIKPEIMEEILKRFSKLSPQNIFYEIMCYENKNDKEIMRILCKTYGSLRTMKSRIRAREI